MPFLKGEGQTRRPITSVYGKDNFAVIDENYRYIRYANGDEELYERAKDPNEWDNIAGNPQYDEVKAKLSAEIPAKTAVSIKVGAGASRINKK